MKIAFIAPDDLSTLIFCKTFTQILNEEYKADVFTISPVEMYREELKSVKSTHIDISMKRWISPFYDLLYLIRLIKILRKKRFDYVVTFTTKPNIYGVIAAKIAGVPNVTIAVRGLGQIFTSTHGVKQKIIHILVKYLYSFSCSLADKVWFTNKNDLSYFTTFGIVKSHKTFLTKNAVNLTQFCMEAVSQDVRKNLKRELEISEENKVVIMVARLIWSKGIKEYVESAKILSDKIPLLKFLLVAPVEKESAEAVPLSYIKEAEQDSNLIWLGFRKDVVDLYAISDLSVLPSYYKEGGYPRALLEAMALEKPVISSDSEDCKGPVEDGINGYIVESKNSQALSEAIYKVFESDDRRLNFGSNSLKKMKTDFDDQLVVRTVITNIL